MFRMLFGVDKKVGSALPSNVFVKASHRFPKCMFVCIRLGRGLVPMGFELSVWWPLSVHVTHTVGGTMNGKYCSGPEARTPKY